MAKEQAHTDARNLENRPLTIQSATLLLAEYKKRPELSLAGFFEDLFNLIYEHHLLPIQAAFWGSGVFTEDLQIEWFQRRAFRLVKHETAFFALLDEYIATERESMIPHVFENPNQVLIDREVVPDKKQRDYSELKWLYEFNIRELLNVNVTGLSTDHRLMSSIYSEHHLDFTDGHKTIWRDLFLFLIQHSDFERLGVFDKSLKSPKRGLDSVTLNQIMEKLQQAAEARRVFPLLEPQVLDRLDQMLGKQGAQKVLELSDLVRHTIINALMLPEEREWERKFLGAADAETGLVIPLPHDVPEEWKWACFRATGKSQQEYITDPAGFGRYTYPIKMLSQDQLQVLDPKGYTALENWCYGEKDRPKMSSFLLTKKERLRRMAAFTEAPKASEISASEYARKIRIRK